MFFMFPNLLVSYYQLVNFIWTQLVLSVFLNLTAFQEHNSGKMIDSAKKIEESKNREAQ